MDGLSYADIYGWYAERLTEVENRLKNIEYAPIIGAQPNISVRVKTIDTLREKLIRQDSTPIYRIHDLMGARVTANMTLHQQDEIVQEIAAVFPKCRISDMRDHPHSGYRAVHIITGLPRGIFAEIQVRTLLQDAWANAFEALADKYGRSIRYGGKPDIADSNNVVGLFLDLSSQYHSIEAKSPDTVILYAEPLSECMRKLADYIRNPNPLLLDEAKRIMQNMH